jgi:type II secretory pathway pseudopilin PulG
VSARRQSGLTMIELLVALSLAVIVVIAVGSVYLTNQRSFRQGREKLLTQQNLSWCMEEVARDLRRAWRADRVNAQKIVLYDTDGLVFATWELGSEGGQDRLLRNGTAQAPEQCTALAFTVAAPDTDDRVRMDNVVFLRNFEAGGPL